MTGDEKTSVAEAIAGLEGIAGGATPESSVESVRISGSKDAGVVVRVVPSETIDYTGGFGRPDWRDRYSIGVGRLPQEAVVTEHAPAPDGSEELAKISRGETDALESLREGRDEFWERFNTILSTLPELSDEDRAKLLGERESTS
jgi:hypothetical protein